MASTDPATEPPLPVLYESLLSWERLDDLLRDIALAGELLEVRLKGHPTARAAAAPADLAAARTALRDRTAVAVQICYRHQSATWRDTLLCTAGGVRLVRIQG